MHILKTIFRSSQITQDDTMAEQQSPASLNKQLGRDGLISALIANGVGDERATKLPLVITAEKLLRGWGTPLWTDVEKLLADSGFNACDMYATKDLVQSDATKHQTAAELAKARAVATTSSTRSRLSYGLGRVQTEPDPYNQSEGDTALHLPRGPSQGHGDRTTHVDIAPGRAANISTSALPVKFGQKITRGTFGSTRRSVVTTQPVAVTLINLREDFFNGVVGGFQVRSLTNHMSSRPITISPRPSRHASLP